MKRQAFQTGLILTLVLNLFINLEKMKNSYFFFISLLVFISACNKIEYSADNPIDGTPTKVLMHKGCGDCEEHIENTLPGVTYGLSVLDGVEVDIQMSKDGTLWLDHSNEVFDCDGNNLGCFQELTDNEITTIKACDNTSKYYTLESVFQLMTEDYPDSYISLDIKGQFCKMLTLSSTMKQMAQSTLSLVSNYNMQGRVVVESSSSSFLKELKDQNFVALYIIDYGDVDLAIVNAGAAEVHGISMKYGVEEITDEVVDLVHRTGYGLTVWTVNTPEDINTAWNAQPDFIQTDKADFKSHSTE
jgi:glycerophosphoryl diester phosphodiesterase